MITSILLIALTILFLYISYSFGIKRPKGCPPGPPRLPIFGSYLFLMMAGGKWLHKGALWLSKFYKSDIISIYIGNNLAYVVHNAEGVREILYNRAFDGRPDLYLARMRDPNHNRKGIFFQDGPVWKEQRRFILRYMRDFGFGRRFQALETVIHEEILDLIDVIKNGPKFDHEKIIAQKGQLLCPLAFSCCTANSIFYVMFNERIPRAEQNVLLKVGFYGMELQRKADHYGKMFSIIPWIRHFFPEKSCYRPIMESNKFLYNFFETMIGKYIKTFDESYERNFVDLYLKEMQKEQVENNKETGYLYDQFVLSLIDFSFPAFTAIGTQMSLIFQWLLMKPDVLKRIQKEIDEYVGSGRLPCLDDRQNLHYTEATIREGLRMETLVPSDVPHVALYDTEFLGYHVEKGTIMFPSLFAYHSDKRVWNDPENFRPERFLDETGKLCLKNDVSFPFGAGKRLCAGETFARNMLFLLLSSICQNFNVVLAPGENLPDMSKNVTGLIIAPPDYWINLESR
ncbi:probable cytochrome P450 304a1 [Episyrphus balteatus]|uniref:probable cytochrome P450 304a1 n=1 Tax=Episyrphus balteatus TaxID=286459 RepID=UPI0024851B28|nr:probable cytochrome P450 304a1 [Episyrphus balteatus]